ncbi:MAG TPA: hypothetical protein VK973_05890 [Arenicellales bacterium]|nr:hypothetical protein [Arenicellales bacterium]
MKRTHKAVLRQMRFRLRRRRCIYCAALDAVRTGGQAYTTTREYEDAARRLREMIRTTHGRLYITGGTRQPPPRALIWEKGE